VFGFLAWALPFLLFFFFFFLQTIDSTLLLFNNITRGVPVKCGSAVGDCGIIGHGWKRDSNVVSSKVCPLSVRVVQLCRYLREVGN